VNADGSAPAESLLALSRLDLWEVMFTADGRSMVVRTVGGPGRRDIWQVALDSARPPIPLLQSSADEVAPAVSRDGRWLAYVSNESGRAEVYVRSFPGMGARFTVSLEGGTEPMWSPQGGELFYRSGPMMLVAEVRAGSTFEVLRRTPLFSDVAYAVDLTHQEYDVTPEGGHFVMVRNLDSASYLTVILHRFQNLGIGATETAPARSAP
jgi:serine/threonine-protein kinase